MTTTALIDCDRNLQASFRMGICDGCQLRVTKLSKTNGRQLCRSQPSADVTHNRVRMMPEREFRVEHDSEKPDRRVLRMELERDDKLAASNVNPQGDIQVVREEEAFRLRRNEHVVRCRPPYDDVNRFLDVVLYVLERVPAIDDGQIIRVHDGGARRAGKLVQEVVDVDIKELRPKDSALRDTTCITHPSRQRVVDPDLI
eukprot:PhM_4_TR11636/c8_g2_i1/m.6211